jgi:Spy/CpxP family protein refolding chaperone
MKKNIILFSFLFFIMTFINSQNRQFDELGLSQEQKDKVKTIMENSQIKRLGFVNDIKIKQLELEKLIYTKDISKDEVKKKLKEISEIEYELRYLTFDQQFSIMSVLDDQQKIKYKKFLLFQLKQREKNLKQNEFKKKADKRPKKNDK